MTEYVARVAMSCWGKIYKPGDIVKYTDWPPEHREAAFARRVANGDVLLPKASAGDVRGRPMVAALPVWLRPGECLVGLITSSNGRWIVPKGKRKRHERSHACAEREAREEAGVAGRVRGKPIVVIGNRPNTWPRMPVFLLEVRQVFDDWPERHFRERAWCTPLQAAALVDDPDLASAIRPLSTLKAA